MKILKTSIVIGFVICFMLAWLSYKQQVNIKRYQYTFSLHNSIGSTEFPVDSIKSIEGKYILYRDGKETVLVVHDNNCLFMKLEKNYQ